MKLIQRRRLGLPVPDPFDVAWEFSKGEMSLEKSVFDWFDSSLDRYQPKMTPPKPPRHAAALDNIRTNATTEVKAPPIEGEGEGVTVENHPESEHEVYDKGSTDNVHDEPKYLQMDTKTYEEAIEENRAEKIREATREQNITGLIDMLLINVPDAESDLPESNEKVVAEIPLADLSGADPEVVMPDKPKTVTEEIKAARERTSLEQTIQDSINVAEQVGLGQNKKPAKTFSNNKTIGDILNEGAINANTPSDVIEFLHEIVEDEQHRSHTRAKQIFYNNQDDLVEHHGYDEYDEVFEKGIQTIVENPFANPFYDMSAFSIKKERPKGFVAPPAFTPPIDLIKQEQPNAIEGFETNEGDDLSLLPSSVFKNTDTPVVDNMSLLPTGWKNE